MRRTVLAALLAITALATPASAAPLGIRHDRDATAIALAGPDVLVLSEHPRRGLKLVALPRTGGPARTLLRVPTGGLTYEAGNLAASPQRVGVIVETDPKGPDEYRVYSGPPSGPLQLVRRTPDTENPFVPLGVSVDGDRMLLLEGVLQTSEDDDDDGDDLQARAQILDASGWTPIAWASGTRIPVAIAGPYVAVALAEPQRIEVADLATGTPLASVTGRWTERLDLDLAPDGRLAVATTGGIKVAAPGQPERLLAKGLSAPRLAGASVAAFDDKRLTLDLVAADGSSRALGPRSRIHTDVEADDAGVTWLFNGCVRYEAFGTSLSGTDRCPGSEVALWTIAPQSKLRGNTATTEVMCVRSDTGRCKGRLVARLDYGTPVVGRGTFDLPVGRKWVKVPVHFDRRTVARFRRHHGGSVVVDAKLPDGSVGAGAGYSSEFGIEVR